MMRSFAALAVMLAIVSSTDAAVLVRFINTVPQRAVPAALQTLTSTGRASDDTYTVDRVGLQYFGTALNGVDVQSPTLVWTEASTPNSANIATASSTPYGYLHGMPPLRQYHNTQGIGEAQVDRIANYGPTGNSQIVQASPSPYLNDNSASSVDNYEQTLLKLDGVGLYLIFAAGTYQVQAYAVLGATPAASAIAQAPKQLTGSLRSMTFVDGHVYTIVATGFGAYSATTPTSGNTVSLVVYEESTAPTTFGKASIRWFHAIKSYSTQPISTFNGQTSASLALASNIAFGSLSDYFDLAPATNQVFPVTIPVNTQTVIAPSTATKLEVTHDIRAGLRATIICAQNDETTAQVFCRMIPSRVVAYVRLINDLAAQTAQAQGPFGAQALNTINLTLWGSYEFPRPDQTVEQGQLNGLNIVPNHPGFSRGLYGVVSQVAAGTCSGYGEAWVPLLIMDNAVKFNIIRDSLEAAPFFAPATGLSSYDAAGSTNQKTPLNAVPGTLPVANTVWYWGAPIFKRTNFVVKTDSGSTITGETTAGGLPVREDPIQWYTTALLLDEYMEPGQYYSLIVTPQTLAKTGASAPTPATQQSGASERFYWRLDRTIDGLNAEGALASTKASINIIAFADQTATGVVTLRRRDTNTATVGITIQPATSSSSPAAVAGVPADTPPGFGTWNTPAGATVVDAAPYTIDDSALTAVTADPCGLKYPNLDITLNGGDVVDVYLFNTFGCKIATYNPNNLVTQLCPSVSSLTTNNAANTLLLAANTAAPGSPTGFFTGAASTASASAALIFAALLAVVAAMF